MLGNIFLCFLAKSQMGGLTLLHHICTVDVTLQPATLVQHKDWKQGETASLALSKDNKICLTWYHWEVSRQPAENPGNPLQSLVQIKQKISHVNYWCQNWWIGSQVDFVAVGQSQALPVFMLSQLVLSQLTNCWLQLHSQCTDMKVINLLI